MALWETELRRTGNRLAAALLGYFAMVTFVITMAPFDFVRRSVELSWYMKPSDMIANVALFLPIGFLTRSVASPSRRGPLLDIAFAAAFSGLIETCQIFIEGRFASPVDVATNTCGALLGILLRQRIERSALWRPQVVGRIGLDIPLVGLLYLLIPQLWLSGVGLVDDPRRSATMLLLGVAGSIVLVALHRHRWQGGMRLAAKAVPPIALLWFATGALPTLTATPQIFAALAIIIVAVTIWLLRPAAERMERRFESDTLGRFIPVFMLYLVVAALWPPLRTWAPWHAAIGFADGLHNLRVVDVLLLLEQVAGFTLLGYAAAESRGRRELTFAEDLPPVTLAALAFAATLEVLQGMFVGPGGSLLRALFATGGAVYGAAVYHFARSHVRALRASQSPRLATDQPRAA